ERSLSIISIIVDGSTDEIGALTGRLGQIPGIKVKSTLVTR
ncbi:MAG: CopG family transcriptional regulator, partial [Candidatus Atribacteria bacterium]|nr:CopG family transcriptional regulator [Candidatus Atribacteria bacterium]